MSRKYKHPVNLRRLAAHYLMRLAGGRAEGPKDIDAVMTGTDIVGVINDARQRSGKFVNEMIDAAVGILVDSYDPAYPFGEKRFTASDVGRALDLIAADDGSNGGYEKGMDLLVKLAGRRSTKARQALKSRKLRAVDPAELVSERSRPFKGPGT